ncbi:MAG: enoyl-CoA hydratase-related protein [Bacteroidota bacterium]
MDQTLADGKILVSQTGHIKTITFNQPYKKNALSGDMAQALTQVIAETAEDDSRVVILTGAEKDFCSGADLDPRLVGQGEFNVTDFLRQTYNPSILAMREMNKIFVAKVRGACVGVGFNFALGCDLIYASQNTKFNQIFTRIGFSSDGGGGYFMPAKLGYHKAFELMAFNKSITGEEAGELGLVNQVFADAELDQAVQDISVALAEGPFLAIQHTKANIRTGMNEGLAAALEVEAVNQGKNIVSHDFMEGISAFLQKRKPKFKGK